MKLFTNPELLEERPSRQDMLEYGDEIDSVKRRVDALIKRNKHSIVAYLGDFGVGKSSVLGQVEEKSNEYHWMTFEMWRYANRNELWDAFVIGVIAQLTKGKDEYDVADLIDGQSLTLKQKFAEWAWVLYLFAALSFMSLVIWLSVKSSSNPFLESYFKYAAPVIITILLVLGLGKLLSIDVISKAKPIKRVFELEAALLSKLKRIKKPLVIIVEDADRSGEDGFVFLETLNYFLKRSELVKARPIIVISPQTASNFDRYERDINKGLERSIKIYDEKIYFRAYMNPSGIAKLYSDLGAATKWRAKLSYATEILVSNYRNFISIRLLKHILRELLGFMEDHEKSNPVLALAIIMSKYISVPIPYQNNQQRLASIPLMQEREHEGEGIRPFFMAIGASIDDLEYVSSSQLFLLKFTDDTNEVLVNKSDTPNGRKRISIIAPSYYKELV